MHKRPRHTLSLNRRHVAGHALATRAAGLMMCVLLQRGGMRPIRRRRPMAIQANLIRRLPQLRIVFRAMHVVAGGASDPMLVHHALGKIVSLHAILVRRAVGKIVEAGLSQRAILKFPEVLQPKARAVADRPVVKLAFNRVGQRLSLRMTLDARVIGSDIIHLRGTENVARRRVSDMLAPWPMAALATNVPFGDGLGSDVVVDRVAPIAKRAGRALEVVRADKAWPTSLSRRSTAATSYG